MSEKRINLFEEFGVSDERAHEIRIEITENMKRSEYLSEVVRKIPDSYDQESIVLGLFLAELIFADKGRLLSASIPEGEIVVATKALRFEPKGL